MLMINRNTHMFREKVCLAADSQRAKGRELNPGTEKLNKKGAP